jgi:transposase
MKGGYPLALSRRRFTREFKVQVIREVEAGKALAQAAREHQLHPTLIRRWQKEHQQYAEQAFAGNGHLYKAEARIAELERLIGQLTMENLLLKKALLRLEGRIRRPSAPGER